MKNNTSKVEENLRVIHSWMQVLRLLWTIGTYGNFGPLDSLIITFLSDPRVIVIIENFIHMIIWENRISMGKICCYLYLK